MSVTKDASAMPPRQFRPRPPLTSAQDSYDDDGDDAYRRIRSRCSRCRAR